MLSGFFHQKSASLTEVTFEVSRRSSQVSRMDQAVPCGVEGCPLLYFGVYFALCRVIKSFQGAARFSTADQRDRFFKALSDRRRLNLIEAEVHFPDLLRIPSQVIGPSLALFRYLSVILNLINLSWGAFRLSFLTGLF